MKTEICDFQDLKEKTVSYCSVPSKDLKINTYFINNTNTHQSFRIVTEKVNKPNGDVLVMWTNLFDNSPGSTLIRSKEKHAF